MKPTHLTALFVLACASTAWSQGADQIPARYTGLAGSTPLVLHTAPVDPTSPSLAVVLEVGTSRYRGTLSTRWQNDPHTLKGKLDAPRGLLGGLLAEGQDPFAHVIVRQTPGQRRAGTLSLRFFPREATYTLTRAPLPVDGERWQALSGHEKQRQLTEIAGLHPYESGALPEFPARSPLKVFIDEFALLRVIERSRSTVAARSDRDLRNPSWRAQGRLGATAPATFVPSTYSPLTGLFAQETPALVRITLDEQGEHQNRLGLEVKLLVDGRRAHNLKASAVYDPYHGNTNSVFAHTLTSLRSYLDAASVNPDGSLVSRPMGPTRLTFAPSHAPNPVESYMARPDFRVQLQRLSAGDTIYEVLNGEHPMGSVRLSGPFVAAYGQDRLLNFGKE